MYATGESAVAGVKAFFRRLAGPKGEAMVDLAGGAIRAVAMGVVVTAVAQSLFAGLGLLIAGVPFVGLLTVLMFVLAIAQIGPLPVLLLVVIWAFSAMSPAWATFVLVWSIVAGLIDNFLKPVLIKKGADLPLLLIFAGVIGGMISARARRDLRRPGRPGRRVHAHPGLGPGRGRGRRGAGLVSWLQRHRLRSFLRTSVRLPPLLGLLAGMVTNRLMQCADHLPL